MDVETPLVEHALGYARRGWPIFPLTPNGKIPIYSNPHRGSPIKCRGRTDGCTKYGHGVLDATTDPDTIRLWWRRQPRCNIGLATGHPGPDVVDFDLKGIPDIDHHTAYALLRDEGYLRGATHAIQTTSGGLHLYYPPSEAHQPNGAIKKQAVDFRGIGGYVVAPPSTVDGRPYLLLRHWAGGQPVDWTAIHRRLVPPKAHEPPSHRPPTSRDGRQLVDWVARLPEGKRNDGLYWAACQVGREGLPEETYWDLENTAITEIGLKPHEVRATIQSARRQTGGY